MARWTVTIETTAAGDMLDNAVVAHGDTPREAVENLLNWLTVLWNDALEQKMQASREAGEKMDRVNEVRRLVRDDESVRDVLGWRDF